MADEACFPIGSTVILQNLINGASYNNLRGIVKSNLDPTTLRQNVFVVDVNKIVGVKPMNMKHCEKTDDDDVGLMSIKELKAELQSYNMSTESYFDKSSLAEAVRKARGEGWRRPISVSSGVSLNDKGDGVTSKFASASAATSSNSNTTATATSTFSSGYQSKKRSSTSTSDNKNDNNDNNKTSNKKKKGSDNLPVEVALAKTWNENTNVTGYYMSEKLDGMRCIWDGEGNIFSRNGNLIHAPSFFTNALPTGTVLDGELFLGRGEFQQCMSIAKQSSPNVNDWKLLTLVVFDAPLVKGNFETRLQAARDALLRAQVDTSIAKVLPHVKCRGKSHVLEELNRITSLNGEGVMLRNPNPHYKSGRTADLLKVKKFIDAEARVVGRMEGKGRNEGRLGALVCTSMMEGSEKKDQFKVGSGFSDYEREWENAPQLGSVITYRYFELTDAGKPRFPSFVRVRPSE